MNRFRFRSLHHAIHAGRLPAALTAALFGALIAANSVMAASPVWAQVFPPSQPSARAAVAMAYDATTKQTIQFGGWDGTSASIGAGRYGLNQTWDWNGTDWVRLHPTDHPTRRTFASMAYDAASGQLLLFGGLVNRPGHPLVPSGETWLWTGSNWKLLHPATSPPGHDDASMAYDPATHLVMLFGGDSDQTSSGYSHDTWAWNGTTWTHLHPHDVPPARQGAALAWSPSDDGLILFGGETSTGLLNDTWRWNGTTWKKLHPAHLPGRRTDAGMAWDATARQLVMVGGDGKTSPDSAVSYAYTGSWQWLNGDWVRTSSSAPKGRYAAGLAYVPSNRGLILFGGAYQRDNGNTFLGLSQLMHDTWVHTAHPPA